MREIGQPCLPFWPMQVRILSVSYMRLSEQLTEFGFQTGVLFTLMAGLGLAAGLIYELLVALGVL